MPSPGLSSAPSPFPTEFQCAMTEDGSSMDPSRFLQQAHPILFTATGTSYALAQTVKAKIPLEASLNVAGFFNVGAPPGSSFSFKSEVAGIRAYGEAGPPHRIRQALWSWCSRTARKITTRLSFEQPFQVLDAVGRTRVSTSGLTVL